MSVNNTIKLKKFFTQSTVEPRGFLAHKWAWGEEAGEGAKPRARENLWAHKLGPLNAPTNQKPFGKFPSQNLTQKPQNSFWLDRHNSKDLMCVPGGSLTFGLFATCSFMSEKKSGFQGSLNVDWEWIIFPS